MLSKTISSDYIAAMKAKQNVDSKSAASLKESIEALESYYPEPDHDH